MIEQEDKARLEAERAPKAVKKHAPGEPIAMPSLGGRGSTGVTGEEVNAPIPMPPGAIQPGGRRIRNNPGGAPAPRGVDRVE